jgi:hypothetical protein
MAAQNAKPASPPSPPKPKPVAPETRASQATAMGSSTHGKKYLRPWLYLWKFTTGTVSATLDDTAKWATKGMWFGIGLTIILGIATGGTASLFAPILMGAASGFVIGAGAGGLGGFLTGGIQNVRRERRAEKYADDLIEKQVTKSVPATPGLDYRDAYRAHQQDTNYMIDRLQQQEREVRQETWQERIMGEHHHERGL